MALPYPGGSAGVWGRDAGNNGQGDGFFGAWQQQVSVGDSSNKILRSSLDPSPLQDLLVLAVVVVVLPIDDSHNGVLHCSEWSPRFLGFAPHLHPVRPN